MRKQKKNKHKKMRNNPLWHTCCAFMTFLLCYYWKFDFKGHVPELIGIVALMLFLPYGVRGVKKFVKKRRYLRSTLYTIDHMSGVEFEEFLKMHFQKSGYTVQLTPKSNDYGIDLICRKKGIGRKKEDSFVVQAKRYQGKVGISAVQQVIGGMRYYDCETGMVITNNYFTKNAWELAKKSGVQLWDRNILEKTFHIRE